MDAKASLRASVDGATRGATQCVRIAARRASTLRIGIPHPRKPWQETLIRRLLLVLAMHAG